MSQVYELFIYFYFSFILIYFATPSTNFIYSHIFVQFRITVFDFIFFIVESHELIFIS